MKYNYVSLMLCLTPFISAMELPYKNMSSILIPDKFNTKMFQNIPQEIQLHILTYVIRDQNEAWYLDKQFEYKRYFHSFWFNHDDTQLTIGAYDDKIQTFNLTTNERTYSFQHATCAYPIYYDHTCKKRAMGWHDIKIFNPNNADEVIATFKHENEVTSACFNYNNDQLATGSDDGAYIFDLKTNTEVAYFEHNGKVNAVCFNHKNNQLAIGSDDGAYIFDLKTNTKMASFKHDSKVKSICFNDNDSQLATGSGNGTIKIFNLISNKEDVSFRLNRDVHFNFTNSFINSICFNHAGNQLVAGVEKERTAYLLTRHTAHTFNQLVLKKLLTLWLCIEKPNKEVNSVDALLKILVSTFKLNNTELLSYETLHSIWKTFPENMQQALWRTIDHKIQHYGKIRKKI